MWLQKRKLVGQEQTVSELFLLSREYQTAEDLKGRDYGRRRGDGVDQRERRRIGWKIAVNRMSLHSP